jgi:hypothetical protein
MHGTMNLKSTIHSRLGAIGLVWTFERTFVVPEVCILQRGNRGSVKLVNGHDKSFFLESKGKLSVLRRRGIMSENKTHTISISTIVKKSYYKISSYMEVRGKK